GTCLTYRHASRAGELDVTLATLDDPTLLAPQMHLWVGEKLPWVSIGDRLPQFPAGIASLGT
ncbi:MAG: GFA family protein, partial [Steroidobacteraceae bacterium]